MNKQLIKGAIVGVIAPIAAFVVYVAFFTEDSDPIGMYNKLVVMDKLPEIMSLSVLINLLIFFINIKTHRDEDRKRDIARYNSLWHYYCYYKVYLIEVIYRYRRAVRRFACS